MFLEASAAGVPIVVGDSGGAPETVRDEVTGLAVDGHKPETVRDALIRLLDDPAWARSLGQQGRVWVTEEWNWRVLGNRLQKILNNKQKR